MKKLAEMEKRAFRDNELSVINTHTHTHTGEKKIQREYSVSNCFDHS